MTLHKQITDQLKAERERQGITLEEMATKLRWGTPRQYISGVLNGRYIVSFKRMEEIAAVLGMEITATVKKKSKK